MVSQKLKEAFHYFDEANGKDPNKEIVDGISLPKELLYAQQMTEELMHFMPNASEALQLAARCQHLRRWEIPRDSYEMDRVGYLKWREALKRFHAEKATEILERVGYESEILEQVRFLLLKKQLKKNQESQTLEDVICIVFLKYYFGPFAEKHSEEKLVDILQKTWKKMSPQGQKAALELSLPNRETELIKKALDYGAE
nr:DUF4202 domain-containing protein [Allomuricauda sp.]